jgi:hypothetical protein
LSTSIGLNIDLEQTSDLLLCLAEEEPITFQTFSDDKSRIPEGKPDPLAQWKHGFFDAQQKWLERLNRSGAGVFWMVNEGDGSSRRNNAVKRVRVLVVDFDGNLEPGALRHLDYPPHAVVQSSTTGRGQAYWRVDDLPLEEFKAFQVGLAKHFGGDAQVNDLARVMRLPGFYHHKAEPVRSELLYTRREPPYSRAELVTAFPSVVRELEAEILARERVVEVSVPTDYSPPEGMAGRIQDWVVGLIERKHTQHGEGAGWRHGTLMAVAFACRDNRLDAEAASAVMHEALISLPSRNGKPLAWSEAEKVLQWAYVHTVPGTPWELRRTVVGGLVGAGSIELPQPEMPPEYRMVPTGEIYKVIQLKESEKLELITPRPLYVKSALTDVSTNDLHLQLEWSVNRRTVSEVVSMEAAVSRGGLLKLASRGCPVDEIGAGLVGRFLARYYAYNEAVLPHSEVSSRMGWHDGRFMLPGGDVPVLGVEPTAWEPIGSFTSFCEALKSVFSWGVTPLGVLVAASASAPLVGRIRLAKNPLFSLSGLSHSGKTTAARFAVAMWGNPGYNETLYFDNGTVNGLAARIMARMDLPVALDDVQRYDDKAVNELLHLLAGGAEKVRASRTGGERAARRWQGIAILTGETSALRETMGTGALNRLIELSDPPLGVGKGEEGAKRARMLLEAAVSHYGAGREGLLGLLQEDWLETHQLYTQAALRADSPADLAPALGLVAVGAVILERLAGVEPSAWPAQLVTYLARAAGDTREEQGELPERAYAALRDLLVSYYKADYGGAVAKEVSANNATVAVLTNAVSGMPQWAVNLNHRAVKEALEPFGGGKRFLKDWARLGLIEVQTTGGRKYYEPPIKVKGTLVRWPILRGQVEGVDSGD